MATGKIDTDKINLLARYGNLKWMTKILLAFEIRLHS